MAGMMAETYMLQAISNGIASIKQDPSQLSDILSALSPGELQQAQTWFGDSTKQIIVAPGFPQSTNQLPFIGVTVATENQIAAQTGIGYAYERVENDDGTYSDLMGARFLGQLKSTIYTPDANLIIWLSAVCKWSLLVSLGFFDSVAGFNNVQISVGDYEPSPDFLPIFTFARGVFLSAEYDSTFKQPSNGATTWTVDPTFQALSD